jgi:hypothetical protein
MADLENATPFAARVMPSADHAGCDVLLIVVAAHFELPGPDENNSRLRLLPTQEMPPLVDEYAGEPGQSSILRAGQSSYTNPATDICILGDACAPNGRPVTEMHVRVRVGSCAVDLRVSGDRVWEPSVAGAVRPSAPTPFLRMPLLWERAYGGVASGSTEEQPAFEPRNPIGCGFETDESLAIGRPVPNIEDPREPLTTVSDRPPPMGVTPVARSWQPRVKYAGTYDDEWRRKRAPLWPDDFDQRFFCSAPLALQASPHLNGAEQVHLQGLHPEGTLSFRIPTVRLVSRSSFTDRTVRTTLVFDGVLINTNLGRLTLYYRAGISSPLALVKHRETLIRLAAPWEDALPR